MQASFTDLVGTAVVPVHGSDSDELTDLTPAFDMATAGDGMGLRQRSSRRAVCCTVEALRVSLSD